MIDQLMATIKDKAPTGIKQIPDISESEYQKKENITTKKISFKI